MKSHLELSKLKVVQRELGRHSSALGFLNLGPRGLPELTAAGKTAQRQLRCETFKYFYRLPEFRSVSGVDCLRFAPRMPAPYQPSVTSKRVWCLALHLQCARSRDLVHSQNERWCVTSTLTLRGSIAASLFLENTSGSGNDSHTMRKPPPSRVH